MQPWTPTIHFKGWGASLTSSFNFPFLLLLLSHLLSCSLLHLDHHLTPSLHSLHHFENSLTLMRAMRCRPFVRQIKSVDEEMKIAESASPPRDPSEELMPLPRSSILQSSVPSKTLDSVYTLRLYKQRSHVIKPIVQDCRCASHCLIQRHCSTYDFSFFSRSELRSKWTILKNFVLGCNWCHKSLFQQCQSISWYFFCP
jgi:hypothetical protein